MNVVALHNPAITWTARQLDLIKKTKAPDCTDTEFNLFIEAASRYGLDPLLNQISCLVFSKKNADKRRMSLVVNIDGFRARAERAGNYRPDEEEPRIEYDPEVKDPAMNPLGIVKATVRVWKRDEGGQWFPIAGVAYWDEFAPLKDEWEDDPETGRGRKTGKRALDTTGNWPKMPRVMIAKCAEAQALRKGWPDQLSGLYAPEEMDQAKVIDLSPSEIVDLDREEQRFAKLGGKDALMVMFDPKAQMERVPLGQFADRVLEWVERKCDGPADFRLFMDRNLPTFREYWAKASGDALELKKRLEAYERKLIRSDA